MQKEYEVLSIDQLSRIGDVGIEYYYRHRIRTKGKVILTLDIDEKDFTPEKAAPILLKAAQNADAIKTL